MSTTEVRFLLLGCLDLDLGKAPVTYADDVAVEFRKLIAAAVAGETMHHEARVLDVRTDGADDLMVVYEHRSHPGRFGLRRDVSLGARVDREDAAESANMVRIEIDEPPPASFRAVDGDGVQWWGDAPPPGSS